ncbi:lipopolysaccharide assembly protein LapB [Beijerinckia sp. L45]|uniref:tetratricopeptide repeat protein n=1 Tax=Beijerinckia sp. L45 TaxID=1641855 RepID=UPI00131E36DB|nr:hypothetical protein [Beijerinckia sp. L45]
MEQSSRPKWYIVDPEAEDEDLKFWAAKNVDVITCRFGQFMSALDAGIPPLMRIGVTSKSDTDFPLRRFYSTTSEESDLLRGSLQKDVTLVHASMPVAEQTAERFYSGYDTGWGCITQRLDARRKVTDDLLYKALLENEAPTDPIFILLKGPAGAGKTIALKRAAFDAATAYNAIVLWLEEAGQLRADVFVEIADLTRQPIYLFVDQVSLHVEKLISFLAVMKSKHVPVVIIGAEREADWTTYCGELQIRLQPHSIRVGALASSEIEVLLDLLERHNCLGELASKNRQGQVAAFASQEFADRQLLVALHVLTRGLPFEKIVLNEYLSVSPEQARSLYLDIASLNQFGVPVRAGTMTRISGIDFEKYQESFFSPLIDMVAVGRDAYTGDHTYKTRHIHVAQILFRQVFDSDTAKSAQFVKIIAGLDVGYSSDGRVLEGICKGRTLTDNFQNADEVRQVFKAATLVAPKQAYLFQQWAIFESTHRDGDFLEAEFYAETAAWMQPKNSTFIHTQAEVARKRAASETTQVLKDQLRRRARAFLEQMPKADRFRTSSRCKLLVDEVADLSEELGDDEKSAQDQFFSEKLSDAEAAILKAQQEFPDDAEMFEIEARLWDNLKQKTKALKALERAWAKSPRGASTAVRLGKLYAAAGRGSDRLRVLKEAVERDPENKPAHHALALHYLEEDPANMADAAVHFSRCVAIDMHDFESKYMLGQIFFAEGSVIKAADLFYEIHRKAPRNFRTHAPKKDNSITSLLPIYSGVVDAVREGYVLVRSGAYPSSIFVPMSAFSEDEAEDASVGTSTEFRLRFSRRGPVAASIAIKKYE